MSMTVNHCPALCPGRKILQLSVRIRRLQLDADRRQSFLTAANFAQVYGGSCLFTSCVLALQVRSYFGMQ